MTEDVGTRGRTALEVRGLGKRYRAVKALDDCTFTLPAGGVIRSSARTVRASPR